MRVAVTGAGGQLGRALLEALTRRGHTPQALLRADLDLEDPDVESRIASVEADWVIHCAAFTAVDRAETAAVRVGQEAPSSKVATQAPPTEPQTDAEAPEDSGAER